MVEYVLGFDGGGTKTAVVAADLNGSILHTFETGAININGELEENVKSNITKAFSEMNSHFDGLLGCRAVCIGTAGISNPKEKTVLEKTIYETGFSGRLQITGDQETALYGALGCPVGIILIAGTGSICYGKNSAGVEWQSGGWGYLIDDEGSGYAIGRDILTSVVRAYDGRGESTLFSQMVYNQLGIKTIEELIEFIYDRERNKRDIAVLAPNLLKAYEAGDRIAEDIVEKCCNELMLLTEAAIEKLKLEKGSLAMSGSVLLKNQYIREGLLKKVAEKYPDLKCKKAENDASYGAVLIALELLKKYSN